MPTPLAEIPDRYAWDPIGGMKELLAWLPPGSDIQVHESAAGSNTYVALVHPSTWNGPISVPVTYPDEGKLTTQQYDAAKRSAASAWITRITAEVVRVRGPEAIAAYEKPTRDRAIAEALTEARSKPTDNPQRLAPAEDAFVARVLARKQRDS